MQGRHLARRLINSATAASAGLWPSPVAFSSFSTAVRLSNLAARQKTWGSSSAPRPPDCSLYSWPYRQPFSHARRFLSLDNPRQSYFDHRPRLAGRRPQRLSLSRSARLICMSGYADVQVRKPEGDAAVDELSGGALAACLIRAVPYGPAGGKRYTCVL